VSESVDDIASHNHRVHSGLLVPLEYSGATGLQPPEMEILSRLRSTFSDKRILDIGVGGGRTTPFLTEISKDYHGIDYSPQMIERSKRRYPEVDFRVCDARDLSQFRDAGFDLVFFSFNGIDYIDHTGRIRALAEIRRVLSNGGAFAFSSHNRASASRSAWNLKHLPYRINPFRRPKAFLFKFIEYKIGIYNYVSLKKYEKRTRTYELRNDEASRYSLMTYYVYIDDQIRQLEEAGFRTCEVVSLDGKWLKPHDYNDTTDPWVYYLCWP
jgi:SAM-dependent methyltransferase